MSVEIACCCGDGMGLPHSHLFDRVPATAAHEAVAGFVNRPSGWVRIWVDWKQVARALAMAGGPK